MGPNGSGKSTLARVLAGHPEYAVTAGAVRYRRPGPAWPWSPRHGLARASSMAFQYPVEIPGVNNAYF